MKTIKDECYECSSRDTIIINNELICNNCGCIFTNKPGESNDTN